MKVKDFNERDLEMMHYAVYTLTLEVGGRYSMEELETMLVQIEKLQKLLERKEWMSK